MGLLSNLIVRIGSDITPLQKELRTASRELQQFGSGLQTLGAGLTASVSLPLLGVGAAALKAAGKLEQARIGFTGLLHSSEAANAMLKELQQFAATTPFDFPELVTTARKMLALGFAANQVIPSLTAIGDAVSQLGGTSETVDRVTLALGKMQQRGRLSAKEMNELTAAGINGWKYLAEATGKSIEEIRKASEAGAIDGVKASQIILLGLQKEFGGAMKAQSETFQGQLSNARDKIFITLGEIGKILLPTAKRALKGLDPLLDKVKELTSEFAKLTPAQQNWILSAGGIAVVAPFIVTALRFLVTNLGPLYGALSKLAPAFSKLAPAFTAVRTGVTVLAEALGISAGGLAAAFLVAAGAAVYLNSQLKYNYIQTNDAKDLTKKYGQETFNAQQHTEGLGSATDRAKNTVFAFASMLKKAAPAAKEAGDGSLKFGDSLKGLFGQSEGVIGKLDALEKSLLKVSKGIEAARLSGKTLIDPQAFEIGRLYRIETEKTVSTTKELYEKIVSINGERPRTFNEFREALARLSEQEIISSGIIEEVTDHSKSLTKAMLEAAVAAAELTGHTDNLAKALAEADPLMRDFSDAASRNGLRDYNAELITAAKDLITVRDALDRGIATQGQYNQMLIKYLEAKAAAHRATQQDLNDLDRLKAATESQTKAHGALNKVLAQQVSTIKTDLSRGIADAIVNGKKLSDVFKQIAKDIAAAIIRLVIEGALAQMGKKLASLADQVFNLGGLFGKVFGTGSSAAGSVAGGVANAPGVINNAVGGAVQVGGAAAQGAGAATSAVSTVAGVVGAVGSVVSAISGIVSNFQLAGISKDIGEMGRTLIKIENYAGSRADGGIVTATLKTSEKLNYVNASLDDIKTRQGAYPQLIHDRVVEIRDFLRTGGKVNVNNASTQATTPTAGTVITINGNLTLQTQATDGAKILEDVTRMIKLRGAGRAA